MQSEGYLAFAVVSIKGEFFTSRVVLDAKRIIMSNIHGLVIAITVI